MNVILSVLLHSTFTVQILYKLYSLQLNCTYSNYTEGAATCSAAQQHSTFTVQILYKLYSLQLNCTYSNYTQAAAAATSSAAQQHTNCPADIFLSAVQPAILNYTCIITNTFSQVVSLISLKTLRYLQFISVPIKPSHSKLYNR